MKVPLKSLGFYTKVCNRIVCVRKSDGFIQKGKVPVLDIFITLYTCKGVQKNEKKYF